jgi:uncharacterized protein with von Willebrand factor type A (vWA) domain
MANEEGLIKEDAAIEAPASESVPEKTLSVSRVNEIVQREKAAAADKVRKEYEREIADLKSRGAQSVGGIDKNDANLISTIEDALEGKLQKMQDQASQSQHEKEMERVANQYYSKMSAGKQLYDDFEDVTKQFNPAAFAQVTYLASEDDNTPEIIYELSKNPQKLATIDYMAQRDPDAARAMLKQLSDSIKNNKAATANADAATTPDPLNRLKASPVGSDSGNMTVKDYKNADWLKA